MLIVNQQHHELLISYYQHKLRSLPDGYFGVYKNKKAVYITRDPNDKNITPKSKRRLFIETQEGQIYTKLIEETLHIKAKLHYLEEIWKATYWKDPRSISFPLNKRCSGNLTKERFFQSKEMQNPILTDRKAINYNDRILRSKNELIVCRELDNWGYEYKVEIDLSSDGFTEL